MRKAVRTGLAALLLATAFPLSSARSLATRQASEAAQGPTPAAARASELAAQGFDLLARNDAAAAETAFRGAIEAQPELEPAHRGLGLALRDGGKWEAALGELQVAVRLDPNDADAQYALGVVAWTLSSRPTVSRGQGAGLSPSDFQVLAAEAFQKALSIRPEDVSLRLNLAEVYLEAGKAREARVQAEEAVRLAPNNAAAHLALGRAYFAGGEEDRAASEFAATVKLDAREGEAYVALGQLRLFQRKYAQAEEAFRQAVQASPGLASAQAGLAQILLQLGRDAEARAALEKAVALDPQDWQSEFQLGKLLSEAGEGERATALFKQVVALRLDYLPAREQLAMGLLRRGEVEAASSQAEALIVKNPQAAEGHRVMSLVLWKKRDFEGCLAECAMALAADPNSVSMLALQAIALWQLDRKKEAQSAFRQAAKVDGKVGTAEVFCRLLVCEARDISLVSDFLRKNRWIFAPPPAL